jgi:hypothetical protein
MKIDKSFAGKRILVRRALNVSECIVKEVTERGNIKLDFTCNGGSGSIWYTTEDMDYFDLLEVLESPVEKIDDKEKTEMYAISRDELVLRLVRLFHTDSHAVSNVCDEVLDRSGALLGEVMSEHRRSIGLIC